MTVDEIDKLEAGREVDELIAKNVMDCTVQRRGLNIQCKCLPPTPGHRAIETCRHMGEPSDSINYYSTDIGAAWEVIEKICKPIEPFIEGQFWLDGLGFTCKGHDEGRWRCMITTERKEQRVEVSADAETAPLAICRAALKAAFKENLP